MPELVTHTLAVTLIRKPAHRHFAMLLLGAVLPDFIHRSSILLLGLVLEPRFLTPDDIPISWYLTPFNAPIGNILVAYGLSLLCDEGIRQDVFRWVTIGIGAHFLLDGGQRILEGGEGYYWVYPFSWYSQTIGLYWPEDSLYAIPGLLVIVLLREWYVWRKKREETL